MANRYWVGGTASWDGTAGTKWALTSGGTGGEPIPTSADDVFFDGASGANTVTIATGNTGAKSITCTGFTGTLTGTASFTLSGNITLVAGMTFTYTGALTINATSTIVSAGKAFRDIIVNGSGITVTQGDALTFSPSSSGTLTVTQGTFNTGNFNLTCILSSSNTNTRTITLGSSTVSANGISLGTTTNLTFNANTSTVNYIGSVGGGSIALGGLTYYNFGLTATSTGELTISGANTFNNLTVSAGGSVGYMQYKLAANQTVNGTFTVNAGANNTYRRSITSNTPGTSRTITAATTSLGTVDFQDITAAGAGAWTGTSIGDAGNNSGITFTAAKNAYYSAVTAGNWASSNWALSSGAAGSDANFPLPQDTAFIDNSSGTGTLTINANIPFFIPAIDFSARSTALTFALTTSGVDVNFVGSITLSSSITLSGTGIIKTSNRSGTLSITSAGRTWTQQFNILSAGATVSLVDNCTTSNTVTSTNGTLDLNGKTLSITSYITATGTKNLTFNGGTVAISNATTTAWNNAQPTGFTTTAGTGTGIISMTAASAKTFVGGGSTYNCTLSNDGAGALTITGSNTFTTLANGVQPTTFTFTAATTTTLTNWNISGTAGNLVTIGSATAASHTLSKSSGTVNANYLSISRSTATGGATWYAGANSTDGGNNTGWIFTVPPGATSANFLMFFN